MKSKLGLGGRASGQLYSIQKDFTQVGSTQYLTAINAKTSKKKFCTCKIYSKRTSDTWYLRILTCRIYKKCCREENISQKLKAQIKHYVEVWDGFQAIFIFSENKIEVLKMFSTKMSMSLIFSLAVSTKNSSWFFTNTYCIFWYWLNWRLKCVQKAKKKSFFATQRKKRRSG